LNEQKKPIQFHEPENILELIDSAIEYYNFRYDKKKKVRYLSGH